MFQTCAFGTDGIRGVANRELTPEIAFRLGVAAVRILGPHICIGRDTRRSGILLESSLVAGIMSAGGTAHCCGVIPTPAIALLTRQLGLDGGAVISASHNPPEYNGIKFFNGEGKKLTDKQQDDFAYLAQHLSDDGSERVVGDEVGVLVKVKDAVDQYVAHAVSTVTNQGIDLSGIKVVLDCAHGAAHHTSVAALEQLGADVVALNTNYTGSDINVGCGSTHLDVVAQAVLEHGADVGIAHDGDADRMLAVDAAGNVVDGDMILAACAVDLKEQGRLAHNTVVATVMSNVGFKQAMKAHDIQIESTQVGDRYVYERMEQTGAVLGGEQSGHIIFWEHNSTGDGLVTALMLLAIMKRSNKSLQEVSAVMERMPQVLINVPIKRKGSLEFATAVWDVVECAEELLGDTGAVLVRESGTEPLVRVMVEAPTQEEAQLHADHIANAVYVELGEDEE